MNLKNLPYILLASSTIVLTACMTSPGYLFSQNETQEPQTSEMSEPESPAVSKPVISKQMQALSQSCRNNEALKITRDQQASAALEPLTLPIRQGLIDLACQLTDQQIAGLVLYIPPVESPTHHRAYPNLVHQTLISQAKLLGIKVMRLAVSSTQSCKLNSRLFSLETNDNQISSVLQMNLISADTQAILASKQVVLTQSSNLKKPISIQLRSNDSTHYSSTNNSTTSSSTYKKSVFLKP
ncbi:hypothetical protein [Catenovulum adriaticum]|uniref:FlgO domain-containing protein n=1 Tax=Catenovulum adriaticum TaxID=2984846 RepID=A0ABY7AMN2_9ALTE|nr:hypothetical protein [Catenovulum sp. TS8]WAJ70820.1 hypothetical protein OLW01_03135 [Catenovulum sp. TS8]